MMDRRLHEVLLLVFFCLWLVMLASCAQVAYVEDKVVAGVSRYCEQPLSERLLIRERFNEKLASKDIAVCINCPGEGDSCK